MSKMGEKMIKTLNVSRENKLKMEWILQTDVDSILTRSVKDTFLKEYFGELMLFKIAQILEKTIKHDNEKIDIIVLNSKANLTMRINDKLIELIMKKGILTPKEVNKLYEG